MVRLFKTNNLKGMDNYTDPYDDFLYLEGLRESQEIVTYIEGSLTAQCVVYQLDWLPYREMDEGPWGFDGLCVVYLKTVGGYSKHVPTP